MASSSNPDFSAAPRSGSMIAQAIVTRPGPDGPALVKALQGRNVAAVLSPTMDIEPTPDALNVEGVQALAFTSANGVRAFAAKCADRTWPVFAVGEATSLAARAAGFSQIVTSSGDVEGLAETIAGASGAARGDVLHLVGRDQAGDLVAALAARGVSARRAVAYRAQARDRLTEDARTLISSPSSSERVIALFFSARSAALFLDQARASGVYDGLANVEAACLSKKIAEGLPANVFRAIRVAVRRDTSAMLDLVSRSDAPSAG